MLFRSGQALAQMATETVQLHGSALAMLRNQASGQAGDWRELWPNPV